MSEQKGNEETSETKANILKCRDDHGPVIFRKTTPEEGESSISFSLDKRSTCSGLSAKAFGPSDLRSRIEPWLTALAQSEHFSLLLGSGLSQAVHIIATGQSMQGMGVTKIPPFEVKIEAAAKKVAEAAQRKDGNIEDQIRVANEILAGLEHLLPEDGSTDAEKGNCKEVDTLRDSISSVLQAFADAILKGESGIAQSNTVESEKAFNYLVSFLMSFASRSGTRDRLQIFTTNYDRIIEAGAEIAGLHLIDRFVGNLAPIFRSSRLNIDMHYNPPGMRGEPRYLEGVARYTKLHGSLDWVYAGREIRRTGLPFGADSIEPYLKAPGLKGATACDLMIYPNSAKDRETAVYPYVELFRDFAAAICQPNSTLVTYGYSFGDEHINRIIEDMLTIPSTHLVVISYNDPMGRIMKMYDRIGRSAQITLMIGDHLGDLKSLVDYYLPKPAIDRTSYKMAELLRSRFINSTSNKADTEHGQGEEDER